VQIPGGAANPTMQYVQYLNGIARIRLSK
jgi:hypothetical protein